jgi:hypothetical protein|tara:strand:- start:485 stop:595 length:111 start_codon:yes stop_codon:yes gene_type:complete
LLLAVVAEPTQAPSVIAIIGGQVVVAVLVAIELGQI